MCVVSPNNYMVSWSVKLSSSLQPPMICSRRKEKKNYAGSENHSPHKLRKGSTLVPSTVKLLHREKERKNQWGSGGLQAWPETSSWRELIKSTGKGTSGIDKFSSEVHRVHMELGGNLVNYLRIKTQFLERIQSVSVVDGAAHTQKDDVESNGGSLENVAKVFVLFLCGVQLVLRPSVLTVLDLDEVDVMPSLVEVFRLVLSGVGGSTGGWRCCWDVPILPQLPPATLKNPPPFISLLFLCFCSDGSNQHKIWAAGGKPVFIWEAGWSRVGRAIWELFYFQLLSCGMLSCVFWWSCSLLACVGTQRGCAGHCLLVGRGGKFDLLRVWTIPHVFDYIGCLFCIS